MFASLLFLLIGVGCEKEHDEDHDDNENQGNNVTTPPTAGFDCSTVTYSVTIKPLFDATCLACHGSNSPDGALTNYSEIKAYADNGKLKSEVLTNKSMPIGNAYTSDRLAQVKCWLDAGAPNN